jgi:hypothetical protein
MAIARHEGKRERQPERAMIDGRRRERAESTRTQVNCWNLRLLGVHRLPVRQVERVNAAHGVSVGS